MVQWRHKPKVLVFVGTGAGDNFDKRFWFFKYLTKHLDIIVIGSKVSFDDKLGQIFKTLHNLILILPYLHHYDIIVSHDLVNAFLLHFLAKILRLKSRNIIIDTVGSYYVFTEHNKLAWLARLLAKWLFSNSEIICVLSYSQKIWKKLLGLSSKIYYIPYGVSEEYFKISGQLGDYLFSGGRSQRDFLTLIQAVKGLNVKLIIATYGSLLPELKERYHNIYIYHNLSSSKFMELLSKAMIVIVPLKGYLPPAGGTMVRQAMAIGKCVVATRNVDVNDSIIDGETGIYVKPHDVLHMREKLSHLLDNPEEIHQLGSKAKEYAEKYHSEKSMAKRFLKILCEAKDEH